jgi:cell division protein FtsL
MSAPDCFLVAWWVVAVAVGIATIVFATRSIMAYEETTVFPDRKDMPRGRSAMWLGIEMPGSARVALVVAIVLLVVGAFALFFMAHWTRWLLFNSQIFMIFAGAGLTAAAISGKILTKAPRDWPRAITIFMRAGIALFGIALFAAGCIATFKDVTLPRRVVEGHVDRVNVRSRRRGNTKYIVVIDGRRFQSTFEAFVHIQPDRRARVEINPGSGVIVAAEDNALRPIERPRRN